MRIWRQVTLVLICAVLSGLAVAEGVPPAGTVALVGLSGLLCVIGLLVLVPRTPEGGVPAPAHAAHRPASGGRDLLEQIPTPLFVVDMRGRVAYANRAACALMPRLEPGAHYTNLIRAPGFLDGVTTVMRGAGAQQVPFMTMLAGVEAHMTAQICLLPAVDGPEVGPQVLVQLSDQTERMAMERMRTDFIANASHELRTPLASIIGYIETLQGHAREDEAARDHFLGTMSQQAARMQRLVEDLMSLSRIEMDAHTPPTARVDLLPLIHEVTDGLRPLAEGRGAVLDITVPPAPVQVVADRDQLGQVFANLMENALKYGGDDGTVTVSLAAPDPRFPAMVGICVSDTGPGISRQHIHRLTERFYRVNANQSRAQGGTGLGLAIVKHILARHGGELDIASTPGQGSSFTIWLPLRHFPSQ